LSQSFINIWWHPRRDRQVVAGGSLPFDALCRQARGAIKDTDRRVESYGRGGTHLADVSFRSAERLHSHAAHGNESTTKQRHDPDAAFTGLSTCPGTQERPKLHSHAGAWERSDFHSLSSVGTIKFAGNPAPPESQSLRRSLPDGSPLLRSGVRGRRRLQWQVALHHLEWRHRPGVGGEVGVDPVLIRLEIFALLVLFTPAYWRG
jgi:hypothetical protein